MELIIALALWIGGWIAIILCNIICVFVNHSSAFPDAFASSEIVKDGNNLFVTGLIYFIFTLSCYYFSFTIVHWIFFIILSLSALLSTLSCLPALPAIGISLQRTLAIVSALISQAIPLAMMINILKFNIL